MLKNGSRSKHLSIILLYFLLRIETLCDWSKLFISFIVLARHGFFTFYYSLL